MKMTRFEAVSLSGVRKEYGSVTAIANVDLALKVGRCVALVGHNGAGKSTLIKILLGLVRPDKGTVSVLGHDPFKANFRNARKMIGFLPEQVLFQKNMTGTETLAFYAKLKRLTDLNFEELFDRVGLDGAADRKVGTYSKGMRQKLGMAQALMGEPKLLILDEPTTGLDPLARQNIYRIINEEKARGATVLISSHALTELDDRIDQIAIMKAGNIVAAGPIPELRQKLGLCATVSLIAKSGICSKIEQALAERFQVVRPVAHQLKISCPVQAKVSLLSEIMALGVQISDLELSEPTLEDVYNTYSRSIVAGGEDD